MTHPEGHSLLSALIRAGTLEAALATLRPEGLPAALRGPLPISPAVPAALLAARQGDPPDVLCLRRASPAAVLALGVPAAALAHEAAGTVEAAAGGWSASGVPADPARGLIGAVEAPGAMMEVMAGVALAFRLRGDPRVAILVDGIDDAASGHWHEGLNLAAVHEAPLVVVIDASRRHPLTASVPRITTRSPAYGAHGVAVEDADPFVVFDAIASAVERARSGGGTQVVEVTAPAGSDPIEALLAAQPSLAAHLPSLRAAAEAEVRAALEAVAAAPRRPRPSRPTPRPPREVPQGV